MKLTKERARAPVIEDGSWGIGLGHESGQTTYTLSCHGPWVQGKGHEVSYTMHLTKREMLATVAKWLADLESIEREAARSPRP